ncbi:MAG TPA: hypothetical protein VH834_11090 [Solirubrobacteraceae bacterium]|jgi:hypothetical protein
MRDLPPINADDYRATLRSLGFQPENVDDYRHALELAQAEALGEWAAGVRHGRDVADAKQRVDLFEWLLRLHKKAIDDRRQP